MRPLFIIVTLLAIGLGKISGQAVESVYRAPTTNLWMGSYNQFQLTEKLYWRAEFHYRTIGDEDTPYVGRLAQMYNRHALNYFVTPYFNFSVGGVMRLNFSPEPGNPEFEPVVTEPRIWHEYLFMIPFSTFQLYHRVRIEHRWSTTNLVGDKFIFRDRWRYKIFAKIPLNSKQLVPGTIFFKPDVELIMQSGKPVAGSPLEDLRLMPGIGYISTPRLTYVAGMMYTTGQTLENGVIYNQRWILSLSAFVTMDLRKEEKKLSSVRLSD